MANPMRDLMNRYKLLTEETNPEDVVKMKSTISNPTDPDTLKLMTTGNDLFNKGNYYDAYKQYKLAQQKTPNHFWAYYNAANSALNAQTQQSFKLIPDEISNAKQVLNSWSGDNVEERSLAQRRLNNLLTTIRKVTNLNL